MNDDTDSIRGWRRAWPRRATSLAAAVGIAMTMSACGGGNSSSPSAAAGSANFEKEVAYSQCVRSHGVPNFPDPGTNGRIVVQGGSAQSYGPNMQAADNLCRHLLPNGGKPNAAVQQATAAQLLKFSECMRSHGVPNFPDPNRDGTFPTPAGLNPNSTQVQSAQQTCESLVRSSGRS